MLYGREMIHADGEGEGESGREKVLWYRFQLLGRRRLLDRDGLSAFDAVEAEKRIDSVPDGLAAGVRKVLGADGGESIGEDRSLVQPFPGESCIRRYDALTRRKLSGDFLPAR